MRCQPQPSEGVAAGFWGSNFAGSGWQTESFWVAIGEGGCSEEAEGLVLSLRQRVQGWVLG